MVRRTSRVIWFIPIFVFVVGCQNVAWVRQHGFVIDYKLDCSPSPLPVGATGTVTASVSVFGLGWERGEYRPSSVESLEVIEGEERIAVNNWPALADAVYITGIAPGRVAVQAELVSESVKGACAFRFYDQERPFVTLKSVGESAFIATVDGGKPPFDFKFWIETCIGGSCTTRPVPHLELSESQAEVVKPEEIYSEVNSSVYDEGGVSLHVMATDSEGYTSEDSLLFQPQAAGVDSFLEFTSMFCREGTGDLIIRYDTVDDEPVFETASQYTAIIDQHAYPCGGDAGFPGSLFCIGPARGAGTIQTVELFEVEELAHSSEQTMPTCAAPQGPQGEEAEEDENDPGDCSYNIETHSYDC